MARKRVENPAYHEWAARIYEREKREPTYPAREVLQDLGYDLDAVIERWRKKRAGKAAQRAPGHRD